MPARIYQGEDQDSNANQSGNIISQLLVCLRTPWSWQDQQTCKSANLRGEDEQAEQMCINSVYSHNSVTYPPACLPGFRRKNGEQRVPGDTNEQELQSVRARFLSIDQLQVIE